MQWLKTFESKIQTLKFKKWFGDSKVVNLDGTPRIVYHGTDKKFSRFSSRYSSIGGIIWFSTNKENIENGNSGASGNKYIKKLYISMQNPAGWNEYEKYTLGQIQNMGYDGVILRDDEYNYDGFVFNTNQIRIAN